MNRRVLMLASLLVLPSALVAQRGGGTQTQANKLNDMFDKSDAPKGPSLRVRDLEDQSPLKLLLDKHKDLKLTDAQVAQLKTNEQTLKDKDAPILKSADSLIHALTPGNPSDAERDRVRSTTSALYDVLGQLRTNYDAAGKDAVALLDADQQPKATQMLDQQKQDASKLIREKLNAGGRSGSSSGSPPPSV